jgi:ABC-type branched-subunit amino acid transport system substrate-binding protein
VTIGFVYVTNAQYLGSLGVEGVTTGDGKAEGQALVNYVNARGGLAGHKITPLYYPVDLAQYEASPATIEQQICTYLTQDHKTFAVVSYANTTENFLSCLHKGGASVVDDSMFVDATFARTIGNMYYLPGDFRFDRAYDVYVSGLVAAGFLTKTSKVGVYYRDTAVGRRTLANVIKPALARYGIPLAATSGISGLDYSNTVLQFRASGVDRVLGIQLSPLQMMQQAESQQYHPRYGVNSQWAPGAILQPAAPPAQLVGAVGVGWQPTSDVDPAHNPGPVSSAETLCRKIMRDAGQGNVGPTTVLYQMQTCDHIFFLQEALRGQGPIDPAHLSAGTARLGDAYLSPVTFRSHFVSGRHDGVSAYRISRYGGSCSCFQYVGPLHAL